MPWVRARAGPRASALHQCTLAAGDNALPSVAVRFPGLAQRPGLSPHGYPADNSPGGQERWGIQPIGLLTFEALILQGPGPLRN